MKIDLKSIKQTKDMIDWIKRQLGYPIVKVEMTDDQIIDCLVMAMNMFIKYASEQSTEEAFYTLMLSGGQREYVLLEGIVDVISFDDEGYGEKGINTLFTIENQMFNSGMVNFHNLSEGLTLLNYHMAMDFLELIQRYTTTSFQWNFDVDDRTLTISPELENKMKYVPDGAGNQKLINSPGWILLKVKQLFGASSPNFSIEKAYVKLFNKEWVKWYSLALCKILLGNIRSKFESFSSIGNTGISLNGSDILSQGKEEKEKLEEDLFEKESWAGYGIITGIL